MAAPPRIALVSLAAALVAAVGAAPGTAATPRPGTFAGSLGTAVPKGSQAEVRAVDRATGRVAAAQTTGRAGRFTLTLAPGNYVVLGAVVPSQGAATAITQTRVGVSLKAGQRRTGARLRTRRTARRRPGRTRGRAAFAQERGQVTPGSVAVEIPPFTGATGDLAVMNRGMANMLITDVTQGSGTDCDVTVREVERISEVLKELEFQQSPYVDPSTRLQRNFVIGDVEVKGTLATRRAPLPAGTKLDYDVRLIDKKTGGELVRIQGSMNPGDLFAGEQALAKQLNDELCKLSDVYEVKLDVTGSATFATHIAGGRIAATLKARRTDRKARVWTDQGTFQWQDLTFVSKINCSYLSPVAPTVPWSVTLTDQGGGTLRAEWRPDTSDLATASVQCPGKPTPPPVPGQPGPALTTAGPMSFTVPYAGGRQAISGGIVTGGDGWTTTGSITVTPSGVARTG